MIDYSLQGAFTYIISFDSYNKQKKQWERILFFFQAYNEYFQANGQLTQEYTKNETAIPISHSIFLVGWQFDSTGCSASVSEKGIRTDTKFLWYSNNFKNTVRDKKKDALKYIALLRLTSKQHTLQNFRWKDNLVINCES